MAGNGEPAEGAGSRQRAAADFTMTENLASTLEI
jgi:hypothetical protein